MDKLQLCRVCLAGNVQMYLIVNKNLCELYKKLTDIQFVTRDRRPMLACYFCYTRLKQCYQLQKQCLEAEELFAQMINEDIMPKPLTNPDGLEFYKGLIQTPVMHINISDEKKVEYDPIKEKLPETVDDKAELKEEPLSDEDLDYSCLHVEEMSSHHPEPYLEDGGLMEVKIEVKEEAEVSEKIQRANDFHINAVAINRRVHTGRIKLEDGITEEENNTKQSNSKIDSEIDKLLPGTALNIKKPSSYAKSEPKPLTNLDNLEFYNGFVRTPVVHINISTESQVEYDAIKEESPETLDDIAELKEEPLSDEDLNYSCLHVQEISVHHPEPYSEDDVPLMEIKTEVEEEAEVLEKNKRANDLHSDAVAINRKVVRRSRKLGDGITEEENNTEQSNTKMYPKIDNLLPGPGLNIKKPARYAKPEFNNITLDTIRNGANNEDKTSKSNKSIDSDDVNKHRVQSVKCDDLDKLRVQDVKEREKQFYCDTCSRVLSNKRAFKKHIRTHTGEKSYKCDICEYSSNQRSNLIRHIRIHSGEKPYKCTICQRSFIDKTTLKQHIRVHTGEKPYKCTICPSTFNKKSSLITHVRIHTGEKPYKCTICQSSFIQNSGLIRHVRIHTKEKPYKCTICQSSFNQISSLIRHVRKHTEEKS